MNYKLVLRLTGRTLAVEALCLLLPLGIAFLYGEDLRPFVYTIALVSLCALGLSLIPSNDHFFAREGFFSVALIWILVSSFGALPYWFSGYFSSYIDCLFESISGFTTTGSSILTAVEGLPHGILFWRSFSQWLGGMGVLVLAIALLPSLGSRTLQVMRAESPGPVVSKQLPKTSHYSKMLYTIYFCLTLIQILCLLAAGMPLFDSVNHSLATAGTGGFSIRNLSVGAYGNPAAETIISIFSLLFATNFTVYFLTLSGKVRQALRSDELRFYGITVLASTLLIAANTRPIYETALQSVHHAFFQVSTVISSTGFSSVNFDLWPEFSRTMLLLLMLCGACAGSTGGGIKCARFLVLFKVCLREIRKIIHPRAVSVIKLDGQVLEESTIKSILIFFATYLLIIFFAMQIVSLDNFSMDTSLSAVISCMGNIGPGLGMVGPTGNFSAFSDLSKLTLSFCMIVGRLEIFPVLVLMSRSAWKRS